MVEGGAVPAIVVGLIGQSWPNISRCLTDVAVIVEKGHDMGEGGEDGGRVWSTAPWC